MDDAPEDHVRADVLKAAANKSLMKNDLAAALKQLNEAIGLASSMSVLWSNRAYIHELRQAHDLALSDARQCIALSPGFAKGYLRAAKALTALGKSDEACEMLSGAMATFPQDYSLIEAFNEATAQGGSVPGGVAASEAAALKAPEADRQRGSAGLSSSYYYAAVPASQRKQPVDSPQLIASGSAAPVPIEKAVAASGAVKADIDQKGDDSYYYAHARTKDYHVPTVPKRIEADGTLRPWAPADQRKAA